MKNRIVLFNADPTAPTHSPTFSIDYGKQVTITAMGLQAGDDIGFEMVYVPSLNPDECSCPPIPAVLPSVAASESLQCCGSPIQLTSGAPVIVLDVPQRTLLRAVLTAADPSSVWAWATDTNTPDLNDRLRGCGCV